MAEEKKLIGKYEVYQEHDFYRYSLKASNGLVLIESEPYMTKDGCLKAIETVQKNIAKGNIVLSRDKRKMFQFKLIGMNKKVLALSSTYSTEKNALSAMDSFKRFGAEAKVAEVVKKVPSYDPFKLPKTEDRLGGKVTFEKTENKLYVYRLVANNGQLLCESEEYTTKASAKEAYEALKKHLKNGTFYCFKSKNKDYQLKLYSKTNHCVLIGESFDNKQQVISNAESIKAFINKAV